MRAPPKRKECPHECRNRQHDGARSADIARPLRPRQGRQAARKLAERTPVLPLTREQRVRNYANGRGWTADFTPAQRRRLDHKDNRAVGNHNPYITKVDGAKAFTAEEIK